MASSGLSSLHTVHLFSKICPQWISDVLSLFSASGVAKFSVLTTLSSMQYGFRYLIMPLKEVNISLFVLFFFVIILFAFFSADVAPFLLAPC